MYVIDKEKIEAIRCQRHMKKSRLASAVGYSASGYAYFEMHGTVKSRLKVLAFCKFLGIDDPADILIHPRQLVNRFCC